MAHLLISYQAYAIDLQISTEVLKCITVTGGDRLFTERGTLHFLGKKSSKT